MLLEAQALRAQLATLETELKVARSAIDQLREQRLNLSSVAAKLSSDLEYLEASCLTEVNLEAADLRADEAIERLESDLLATEEERCREIRQRIEQMGPVNMMALEEYKETAERHGFLEAQRKDLNESIANIQETIREIDLISRTKFDEAFARINENFGKVFTRLFNGGQASLRLTDIENQAESGLEIVASPQARSSKMCSCSRVVKSHSPRSRCSLASSNINRAPFAFLTKLTQRLTKPTSAGSLICCTP